MFKVAIHYLPLQGQWEDSKEKCSFFVWIVLGRGAELGVCSTVYTKKIPGKNRARHRNNFLQTQKVARVFAATGNLKKAVTVRAVLEGAVKADGS